MSIKSLTAVLRLQAAAKRLHILKLVDVDSFSKLYNNMYIKENI